MAHYAKVKNGVVTQVIVAEKDFIDTLPDKTLLGRGGVNYAYKFPQQPNT